MLYFINCFLTKLKSVSDRSIPSARSTPGTALKGCYILSREKPEGYYPKENLNWLKDVLRRNSGHLLLGEGE